MPSAGFVFLGPRAFLIGCNCEVMVVWRCQQQSAAGFHASRQVDDQASIVGNVLDDLQAQGKIEVFRKFVLLLQFADIYHLEVCAIGS